MAYLIELVTRCRRCLSIAAVELFGNLNDSYGKYCYPCGALLVLELNEEEGPQIEGESHEASTSAE